MAQPTFVLLEDERLIQHLKGLAAIEGVPAPKFPAWAGKLLTAPSRRHLGIDQDDLSPKEAAAALGVSKRTIMTMHRRHTFPNAFYINARVLRIPRKDIEAMRERTVAAA